MTYKAKITEIVQATPSIKLFRFKPDNGVFDYKPGQFIMLSLDHVKNENGAVLKRSYSVASSPLNKEYIELCISILPDGRFTPHLGKLKFGDVFNVDGPFGKFFMEEPKDNSKKYVFIATGAGVAPLISMIRTLLVKHSEKKITLLYGFRHPEDYCYKTELENFAKKYKTFELHPTISTKDKRPDWKLDTGRVTTIINKYVNADETEAVYICGNPEMVKNTVEILKAAGISEDKIKKEQW